MTLINISRLHFPVTALGPGRRVGIWVQGCSIRCPGCISADTWASDRGSTTVAEVINRIAEWTPSADGITISGGEPFDQPTALVELVRALRRSFRGDILVYSGHSREAIERVLSDVAGLVDALVSDRFILELTDRLPLRGSDNQRLHILTQLGAERYAAYAEPSSEPRALDVGFDEEGSVWFAGIPRRGDFQRLRAILERAGHKVATSEDQSARKDDGSIC